MAKALYWRTLSVATFCQEARVSSPGVHWYYNVTRPFLTASILISIFFIKVLQLINRPAPEKPSSPNGKNEESADEWGEFLHLPGQKFYDFNKIREEIVRDTELKTGKNLGKAFQRKGWQRRLLFIRVS